jgi:hypothetical protein
MKTELVQSYLSYVENIVNDYKRSDVDMDVIDHEILDLLLALLLELERGGA